MPFRLYILISVYFAVLLVREAESFHFSDGNDRRTIKQHDPGNKGKNILYNEVWLFFNLCSTLFSKYEYKIWYLDVIIWSEEIQKVRKQMTEFDTENE